MADQQSTSTGGVDPISGFWRDVWARAAAGATMPGAAPTGDAAAAFMTPEAMRRMQAAFFDAMAQYAEQYMRSPEFLAAMKRSMDQALQLRQQMDDFLKSNMATAFEAATGGSNSEILGAIRQTSAQIQAQLSKLDARVSDLEAHLTGGAKPQKSEAKSQKKPSSK
ncbi:MAG: hypothetical protein U0572_04210 [Phycisphaerales bacterium]